MGHDNTFPQDQMNPVLCWSFIYQSWVNIEQIMYFSVIQNKVCVGRLWIYINNTGDSCQATILFLFYHKECFPY